MCANAKTKLNKAKRKFYIPMSASSSLSSFCSFALNFLFGPAAGAADSPPAITTCRWGAALTGAAADAETTAGVGEATVTAEVKKKKSKTIITMEAID
jgi:hypothetical protein